MKQIVKRGRVSVNDRNGIIYLVWNNNGQRFKESTGQPVNGNRLPDSVQKRVKEINDGIAAARGKAALRKMGVHIAEPSAAEIERVPLDEALGQTVKLAATQNDRYVKNMEQAARYFQTFMRTRYPGPTMPFWDEITAQHVVEFIQAKKADGLKNKTIRNYVALLTATSRLYADINPDRYREFRIDIRKHLPLVKKEIQCLAIADVLQLIPICTASRSNYLEPVVYFGSLAGLNIAEIQGLQKKDWNSKAGVLTIRRAKTESRPRRIPVVGIVREWADKVFAALPAADSYLITTTSGNPIPESDYTTVTRAFRRRVLEPAAKKLKGGERFAIAPSDCCRETFINAMVQAGVDGDIRRAYVGHTGNDSHTRHYAITDAVTVLEKQVVQALEKAFPALRSDTSKQAKQKRRGAKVVPRTAHS